MAEDCYLLFITDLEKKTKIQSFLVQLHLVTNAITSQKCLAEFLSHIFSKLSILNVYKFVQFE